MHSVLDDIMADELDGSDAAVPLATLRILYY